MNSRGSGIPWWAAINFRKEAEREPDFADMGTAFGLDASLADNMAVTPSGDGDVSQSRMRGREWGANPGSEE